MTDEDPSPDMPACLGEPDLGERPSARGALPAALVPCVAALAALAAHQFLPNARRPPMSWTDTLPAWRHPYPVLLEALLAIWLLSAAIQFVWPRFRAVVSHHGPLTAGAIGMICLWDLITLKLGWLGLPFFPGPDMVLASLISDRGILLESAFYSLRLLLCGYVAGAAAGLGSGIFMGCFRRARYWGLPVLKVLGPLPATAFVPLAMALFGEAFHAGAALVALAVWFPVTMLTMSGMANVPSSYFDVARTLGAGRGYLIFRVAVPAALPSIFVGLFMGLGASFLTLIVAETVGVKSGWAWYLKWQQGYAEYANVYAALVVMAAMFSGLMTLLFKLRDRVLGWQKGLIRW